MGVDQLVTGGDVDNPVFQSVSTEETTIKGASSSRSIKLTFNNGYLIAEEQ